MRVLQCAKRSPDGFIEFISNTIDSERYLFLRTTDDERVIMLPISLDKHTKVGVEYDYVIGPEFVDNGATGFRVVQIIQIVDAYSFSKIDDLQSYDERKADGTRGSNRGPRKT